MTPARSSRARSASDPTAAARTAIAASDRSRASHLAAIVGHLAEADSLICESRSRVPCFLTCLFFCSGWWDTLFALVGHPPRGRQEAGRDDVA